MKGTQVLIELQKHPELFALVFICVGEKLVTAGNELGILTCTTTATSTLHFRDYFGVVHY